MNKEKSTIEANNKTHLEFLANELTLNHISISLTGENLSGSSEKVLNKEQYGFFRNELETRKKNGHDVYNKRNILVVGAGASHNYNQKIPLASEAIKIIRKNLQQKLQKESGDNQSSDTYKLLLSNDLQLGKKVDFETFLQLLTKIINVAEVRDQIKG
ncbi:MAG: hypothetical protein AAFW89_01545 [Bacteroidota bacterium]